MRENFDRLLTEEEIEKYMLKTIPHIKTTKDLAFISRELACLDKNLDLNRRELLIHWYDKINKEDLFKFLEDLEFYSILKIFGV